MIKNKRSGQTLLLIALMVTVAVTMVVVISQNATQQIKIATQEAESKKAFAAAEAGIQVALDKDTNETIAFDSESLNLSLGNDISGTVNVDTDTPVDDFELPLLQKDETHTFYFSNYTSLDIPETYSFSISKLSPQDENYCNDPKTKFALELTFINLQNNTITGRRLIDPCSMIAGDESEKAGFETEISMITASLMTVRVMAGEEFEGAKIKINKPGSDTWPAQGKTITSQANTEQQISKRVKLFQSFPQPPAEFYTTRF